MKRKLFSLLTLLVLCATGAWAQSSYVTSFEEATNTYWVKSGGSAGQNTESPRTGSKVGWHSVGTANSEKRVDLKDYPITHAANNYIHLIFYARTTATISKLQYSAYLGSEVGKTSVTAAADLPNSTWKRYSTRGAYSSAKTSGRAYFYSTMAQATDIIYYDDIIVYSNNSSTTDLTAPSAATSASATASSISWTNGSDTGDGATGIQNTLVFKRTSGSADDLTLNDQGIYSLTSTEGPSTDQSGHWTLVSASIAADATSYSTSIQADTRYAIVHRDLAYNYSTPTYVTTPSAKTDVTLGLTSTAGSKNIADGRTFNFSTLATVSSTPDVAAVTDNIKYRSSDTDVAEINATTGAVTLKKAGSTTITAYFEGDANYNEAEVDYSLTVTNSSDFAADLRTKSSGSYGIAADGSEVAVDDPSAVITLTMTGYNGGQHGWNPGTVITVPVTGPTKLVLGTCQYGNGAVTVTNSGDVTVLSFNTKGSCDSNISEDHFVTRYYEGGATTLTITVNNYLPYINVSAVGEDQIEYTIDFDISSAGATGSISSVNVTKGSDFVIPANNSLYVADKTLKSWTNSATATTYNIGESIENVTSNITLTPNFEDNEFALDELTSDVTVEFSFAQGEGAPIMVASGGGSTMRVAQATVATEFIDVLLNVAQSTKFNNNQGAESAQIVATSENPTTIEIPGLAGMTVTMNYNFATSYLGEEDTNTGTWADSKTTWTYTGTSNPVTLTIISDGYPSLMTVTYPAKPTCETPTITPATFTEDDQEVTISSTAGATIYYTTDGTDPTTSSAVYDSESKPTVSSTTTFKAFAVKAGTFDSSIATQTVTRTASTTWGSWDFTNWSSATQAGVRADETNWDDHEESGNKDLDDKCYSNKAANSTFVYGSPATTIPETKGLTFATTAYRFGLAFDLSSTTIAIGGYHGSQYLWLYGSNSVITIPSVPAGATIEIGVESHKLDGTADATRTLNVTNTDKGSVSTDAYTEETFTVSTTGNVTIYPSKGMHIYYITITAHVATVPITIASGKEYTTLTSGSNLDFTEVEGLKPYVVTADISESKVTLSQRNKVAAGNGMVLKAETTGKTYNVPVFVGAGDDVTGNKMLGSATTTTAIPENGGYILKNGVFQPAMEGSLPAGKAYLNIAVTSAHALTIVFDDENGEATSIKGVEAQKFMENNKFYNLNGQEVQNPTKGLYIVNGHKVIIK